MPSRAAEHFLEDYDGRSLPWAKPLGAPTAFQTERILFGNGDNALEVAIAWATRPGQPKAEDLRALFKKRQANRPAPVLLVVTYTGPSDQPLAAVVGTIGDPRQSLGWVSTGSRVSALLHSLNRTGMRRPGQQSDSSLA
ncbi:MAG TPA: hypothetical protein VKG61_10955 [Streptosporangiaceae bacterium]|nr:hypothetical protein [Streptosporangiaceae bacterium]